MNKKGLENQDQIKQMHLPLSNPGINSENKEKLLDSEYDSEHKSSCIASINSSYSEQLTDEFLIEWRNKFIEYLNVVNSFYKSKYLETKEDYENMKLKLKDKKKEYVKSILFRLKNIILY